MNRQDGAAAVGRRGFHGRGARVAKSVLIALGLLVTACATPVSVRRVDPATVHRALTGNVLSAGRLSGSAQNVLRRWGLAARLAEEPEGVLAALHRIALDGRGGADEIYTLSELSFLHAERTGRREWYLAALVYAYAYLFPEPPGEPVPAANTRLASPSPSTILNPQSAIQNPQFREEPNPFDPRLRVACDLYNRALTEALASADGKEVELRAGAYRLPFGELEVEFSAESLHWLDRDLQHFVPMADLEVRGMTNRYRRPGIGAPLAASTSAPRPGSNADGFVSPDLKVPVTALLRIHEARATLPGGRLRATLELHTDAEAVTIGGVRVPLEAEPTAAYAWMLSDPKAWEQEIRGFLHGDFLGQAPTRLTALHPFQPGRIPVVLVHGTASSPGRWADLVNELENDERLRDRIQIWLFRYDTGNPIPYSALLLRQALAQTVARLDPAGQDAALRRMVLIGHSQGGLLIKMTAVDSGDRLWRSVSSKPLEALPLSKAAKASIGQSLFVKPLPFVRRLIYVATPHQGSFVASKRISDWAARFITLPKGVLEISADMAQGKVFDLLFAATRRMPTSVDHMTPGNPFNKALAALPVVPGVATHSIVAVKGEGPVEKGDDGVVKYSSAHLEHVDSELVAHSGHSCQSSPEVIDEVRRILVQAVGEY